MGDQYKKASHTRAAENKMAEVVHACGAARMQALSLLDQLAAATEGVPRPIEMS